MRLDDGQDHAGERLDVGIVAVLVITLEQDLGLFMCRHLLGDIAVVEIRRLGAAQIVNQALVAIVQAGRRGDVELVLGDNGRQLGGARSGKARNLSIDRKATDVPFAAVPEKACLTIRWRRLP